jgi:threonyl-tRNA synthetase
MLVLGEKEQAARAVSIRERSGAQRALVPLEEFLAWIESEVRPPTLA